MDTNEKGNIGLGKIIADLTMKGYYIFLPLTDTTIVDIVVANKSMSMQRMQVKYREAKQGLVIIPFQNVVNGKRVNIDRTKVDCWGVYYPQTDSVYYVRKDEVLEESTTFSFRIHPPKKNGWKMAPTGEQFIGVERLFE